MGRSASLTAPNGPTQQQTTKSATNEGNAIPENIDASECRSTGTPLGDPTEIGCFSQALLAHTRSYPLVLGMSESSITHLETIVAVASSIKCHVLVEWGAL